MYADIFEKGEFFLCFCFTSIRKRRFREAKTDVYENSLQSEGIGKHRFSVYAWTGENEAFENVDVIRVIGSSL